MISELKLVFAQAASEFFEHALFVLFALRFKGDREANKGTLVVPGNSADEFVMDEPLTECLTAFKRFRSVGSLRRFGCGHIEEKAATRFFGRESGTGECLDELIHA